ncbi:ribosomal protein S18-alanine N-acetyltransferase [Desulfuromonas sp. CSMB_57]|uniref:ribosomal protein S18-alanine N-acetyltransferase n=1 Tax=Desulfuromonas sp. CSMB_57 TaxID=2807629 RepID=UPI00202B9296|nr:ribosomal protein S18-alanine N-acetyltransferase [Desulfuromonas sp. CSMB_57]
MAAPVHIRPMVDADLEQVTALEVACHPAPWSRRQFEEELANPLAAIDVLLLGEGMGGYLCSWLICDELHILNVTTHPACRRQQVATRLLRHVLERARQGGGHRAFLEVRVGNHGAIRLYEGFGFQVISRRAGYYADGEDALVMAGCLSRLGRTADSGS